MTKHPDHIEDETAYPQLRERGAVACLVFFILLVLAALAAVHVIGPSLAHVVG